MIYAQSTRDSEEDVTLVSKRREQRERSSNPGASQSPQVSSGAPIFKIFILLFIILLAVIAVLIVNINIANRTIRELEAYIGQFRDDVSELAELRSRYAAINIQLGDVINERNYLQSQVEDYQRQLQVAGTDAGAVPPPGTADGTPEATDGLRRHTVAPGESLYRISVSYFGHGRAAEAIRILNDLPTVTVMVGDVLYIPDTYQ